MPEGRLPVVKVLWGMFAFPAMYPGPFFAAAGLPMIASIAATLLWLTRPTEYSPSAASVALMVIDWMAFAWLAVRVHRLILLGDHRDQISARFIIVANYFGATLLASILFSISLALIFLRYTMSDGEPTSDGTIRLPHLATWILQLVPLYLLSRLSLMLPDIALGKGWRWRDAWDSTRGNGWRLFVVVLLLPWAFDQIVDQANGFFRLSVVTGVLAVIKAVLTAESAIALSLAYRELASHEPPPTTPPA